MNPFLYANKRWGRFLLPIVVLVLTAGFALPTWFNRVTANQSVLQERVPAVAAPPALALPPAGSESRAAPAAAPQQSASNDQETYQGLPVGFTAEGYPYRGDPAAPLTLVEFSDYLCPFCGRHFSQTAPALLEQYGRRGQVRFVFRDFPIAALHPPAPAGHAAALCVAEQGAPLFWQMHDELFGTQQQWGRLADPSDFVAGLAQEIGADMDAYADCMASGQKPTQVAKSVAAAQAMGFNGTPSFQLVGRRSDDSRNLVGALALSQFSQLIDAKLQELGLEPAADLAAAQPAPDAPAAPAADAAPLPKPDAPTIASDLQVADLETYQGLPVGFTEEGYPFRGDPAAPITFIEWSDYLCPFCGRHFNQTASALLDRYAADGQVLFLFRDLPLVALHPTAPVGHTGALCVAEQGAALFWQMHDELFRGQQQWASLPDPANYVAELAKKVGADMDAYADCIDAGQTASAVDQSVAAGTALGFNGTPSFQFVVNTSGDAHTLVGAHPIGEFARWLDALLLNGQPPEQPETAEPDPAELPLWANEEGLAPDPKRPGYTLAGDQYKGNPDAALVVVEFTDFQCPPCQQHALEVQPALDKEFIDSGQIMWVFKHLPLKEHDHAPVAAAAAECAAEQGQFWEMHHALFEYLDVWAPDEQPGADNPDAELLSLAAELELDVEQFTTCFNSRAALERVLDDMFDAQGVVQTTPTFIFLSGGRGSLSQGSRPVDQFAKLVQGRLDEATAAE